MHARPNSRVIKKLQPGTPGTQRLLERFGSQLLCVRYRQSPDGKTRYTTVELLVSSRKAHDPLVAVKLHYEDRKLREILLQHQAQWDPQAGLWRLRRSIVHALKIQHLQIKHGD